MSGKTRCRRESCPIPDRREEYRSRLARAKESGSADTVLLEQYLSNIRARKSKERAQCRRKRMEIRVDGDKGTKTTSLDDFGGGDKRVVS